MVSWLDRAEDNLLHKSVSKNLSPAMREWSTTGGYEDSHGVDEVCELCEHKGLRYLYEIENARTGHSLWVGSICITKFIPLYENGSEVIGEKEKSALLKKRQAEYEANSREQRAMSLLNELTRIDPGIFSNYKWRSNWRLGYSVKQLVMISTICKKQSLLFNAGDFKINTRRESNLTQLRALEAWQYRRLRAALPKARRNEFDQVFTARK